jgi:hypothetical protein
MGKSKNQEKRENGHCRDRWIAHEEIHQVHVLFLRPVTGISHVTMYGISTIKIISLLSMASRLRENETCTL